MATSTLNIETLESLGTTQNGNSEKPTRTKNCLMIIINCAFATIGVVGGPLLVRLYYLHGVVVMTLGSVLLGINIDGDRSIGVSKSHYLLGFLLTLVAAALAGLVMPLMELAFSKAIRNLTYSSLLQFQFVLSLFSTIVCGIGMLVNKDFQAIPREANEFELGKAKYYIIMVVTAIIWQFTTLGLVGLIFYTSALFNGIFGSVLVPFTGVAAIIFYHESFTGLKGMALALCLWGFCSYFYGEYKMRKKVVNNETPDTVENKPGKLDDHEQPLIV